MTLPHQGVLVASPIVRDVDGKYVIDWPEPKPEVFLISSELFELLIADINGARLSERGQTEVPPPRPVPR